VRTPLEPLLALVVQSGSSYVESTGAAISSAFTAGA
jgi:hypothetical protein